VRRAFVLVILAACGGGGDFSVSVLAPCPTCGPGHVRAAGTSDVSVVFRATPTGVLATGGTHLEWLGPDLSTTATADVSIPGSYTSGPVITEAVSGADGHAFVLVSGKDADTGDTVYLLGLDATGHQLWSQEVVDDYPSPPIWLAVAPDGDVVVAADSTSGFPAVVGGITYQGWISITKLSAVSGAVQQTRMFSASKVSLSAFTLAPDGGPVIEGSSSGDINLGGAVGDLVSPAAGRTIFMARLDPQYNGRWAKQYVSMGSQPSADGIAADGQHVYASGSYSKSVDLGDGVMLSAPASASNANYILAYDDAGTYQWNVSTTDNIGVATLWPTPAGVLVGGEYVSALTIGGIQVPEDMNGESALCAELVNGAAAWALASTGNGNHLCTAIGSSGGRSYVQVEVDDNGAGNIATTLDSVMTSGEQKIVLELGTTPAN
jgi:hypothetical protein